MRIYTRDGRDKREGLKAEVFGFRTLNIESRLSRPSRISRFLFSILQVVKRNP
ncbi:MAG: hypothetical protein RL042_260 [Nitrospirota bacterium]|jgi:hypothetical protein